MPPSVADFSATKPSHSLSVNQSKILRITGIMPDNPGKIHITRIREIRNPLTNIGLAAEFLKQLTRNVEQERVLDIIIRNAARINDMLANLIISQNSHEKKVAKHVIPFLLEEVLALNKDRIAHKGVTVSKRYTTQEFTKEFDSSGLKLALSNILITTIDAMPDGKGRLEITIKILKGVCFIIIEDNGGRISEENINSLFNSYFTNKADRTCSGLSGALSILNSDHIRINILSEAEKGTRFILSIQPTAQ